MVCGYHLEEALRGGSIGCVGDMPAAAIRDCVRPVSLQMAPGGSSGLFDASPIMPASGLPAGVADSGRSNGLAVAYRGHRFERGAGGRGDGCIEDALPKVEFFWCARMCGWRVSGIGATNKTAIGPAVNAALAADSDSPAALFSSRCVLFLIAAAGKIIDQFRDTLAEVGAACFFEQRCDAGAHRACGSAKQRAAEKTRPCLNLVTCDCPVNRRDEGNVLQRINDIEKLGENWPFVC